MKPTTMVRNSPRAAAMALVAHLMVFAATANAINISTVPVGNAGNANNPADGDQHTTGVQNFGNVGYAYRIGTYEVTVGEYAAFLNAAAATDTYSLYNTRMATDLNTAGIARSGVLGSYTYSVIGSPNKPVTYVSWGDAARFANWLHNGQPVGAQNSSTTEGGAYPLYGANTDADLNAVSRNVNATWFIPSENEWYKAAFHQPAAQGGDADDYWKYPTRTNNAPNSDQPPGDPSIQANALNFFRNDSLANGYNDGYAVTGSLSFSSSQNYLTDVGAYTRSPSFYGTFDQAGNVWEWNEALIAGAYRGLRGGSWDYVGSETLTESWRSGSNPALLEGSSFGFRVATVPEPSSLMLAAFGCMALAVLVRRRTLHRGPRPFLF